MASLTPSTPDSKGLSRLMELYYDLCHRYQTQPIPEVTIALRFDSIMHLKLGPTQLKLADLLPLGEILKLEESRIMSLDLSGCALGDSGAYVLQEVLQRSRVLRVLDLSFCGICEHGAGAIARGLSSNAHLEQLLLRGNSIGVGGAQALAPIVRRSVSLRLIDVSSNNLRVGGVHALFAALQDRRRQRNYQSRVSHSRSTKLPPLREDPSLMPSASDGADGMDYDETGAWFVEDVGEVVPSSSSSSETNEAGGGGGGGGDGGGGGGGGGGVVRRRAGGRTRTRRRTMRGGRLGGRRRGGGGWGEAVGEMDQDEFGTMFGSDVDDGVEDDGGFGMDGMEEEGGEEGGEEGDGREEGGESGGGEEELDAEEVVMQALSWGNIAEIASKAKRGGAEGLVLKWQGNFVAEEIANSIIHGVGLLLAILGAVPLLQRARHSKDQGYLLGAILYVTGLVLFYSAATLRHSLFFLEHTSKVMHVVDRSAIFLLIAGTYTPFTLVNLRDRPQARTILLATWVFCILGIAVSTATGRRYRRLKILLYLGMGWIWAVSMADVMRCVAPAGILLLLAGGGIYTLGAATYWRGRRLPGYTSLHGLWYGFVLLASLLHYIAVYDYVRVEEQCSSESPIHPTLADTLTQGFFDLFRDLFALELTALPAAAAAARSAGVAAFAAKT